MDIDFDHIFRTFNQFDVRYILIGGMNFSLRHREYTTYDVDLWIDDTEDNRAACERALAVLGAEWGLADSDWGPTRSKSPGWLAFQGVYALHTPHGSIDVFRDVKGLGDWQTSFANSIVETTTSGIPYRGLSDEDMLLCQLALDAHQQKIDRIQVLKAKIQKGQP
jgi:hypothetical protein